MNLYTDGTTKASTDEITTALAEAQAADHTAARDATAADLQTWIAGYYDGREWLCVSLSAFLGANVTLYAIL